MQIKYYTVLVLLLYKALLPEKSTRDRHLGLLFVQLKVLTHSSWRGEEDSVRLIVNKSPVRLTFVLCDLV